MFVFVKKDIWIKLFDVLQALSLDISNYLHPFNYDYTSLYILKRQQQILEKTYDDRDIITNISEL